LRAREPAHGPRQVGKDRDGAFEGPSERERVVADERAVHEEDEPRPGAPHARAQLLHGDAPFRGPFDGQVCERNPGRREGRREYRFGRRWSRFCAQAHDRERISGAESDEAANDASEEDQDDHGVPDSGGGSARRSQALAPLDPGRKTATLRAMTTPTAPLTLFDFPASTGHPGWESFSPFVLEVSRAIRLAKVPFEMKQVNMMKLKDINPLGQLPVVAFGGEKVADSTRILERLEVMVPGSMTGGLDARGVAEAWLWEEFADTSLYPYVLATRWVDERGWPVPLKYFFGAMPAVLRAFVPGIVRRATMKKVFERDFTRAGLDACYERMGRVLDALDTRAPDEGFWLGPKATVADLGLFAHLHSLRLPLIPWQAEVVARRQRLTRYLDRVDAATSASPG
jgi:glutathione S-transferase